MKHYALSKTASNLQLESLKNFQNLIKSTISCKTKVESKTQCVSYKKRKKKPLKISAVCVECCGNAALQWLKCQLAGKEQQNTNEIETEFQPTRYILINLSSCQNAYLFISTGYASKSRNKSRKWMSLDENAFNRHFHKKKRYIFRIILFKHFHHILLNASNWICYWDRKNRFSKWIMKF